MEAAVSTAVPALASTAVPTRGQEELTPPENNAKKRGKLEAALASCAGDSVIKPINKRTNNLATPETNSLAAREGIEQGQPPQQPAQAESPAGPVLIVSVNSPMDMGTQTEGRGGREGDGAA